MSEPQYTILKRFSEGARRKVAGRVFNRPKFVSGAGIVSTCAEGRCIMAALFHAEGTPTKSKTPRFRTVARKLRLNDAEQDELDYIMSANDRGAFATPAAVRAALGLAAAAHEGER